jgi:hypothetical protein
MEFLIYLDVCWLNLCSATKDLIQYLSVKDSREDLFPDYQRIPLANGGQDPLLTQKTAPGLK